VQNVSDLLDFQAEEPQHVLLACGADNRKAPETAYMNLIFQCSDIVVSEQEGDQLTANKLNLTTHKKQ